MPFRGIKDIVVRSVKSAARVVEVLELFERHRRPLRVVEIATLMDAPQSSISMLLSTLKSAGYMDYDAKDKAYCPSLRVTFLCEWLTRSPYRGDVLPDAVRTLARQTSETVLVGRIHGVKIQYVAVLDSKYDLRFTPRPGTIRPLHRSGVGIALLSSFTEIQAQNLLERYNAGCPAKSLKADVKRIMREVGLARQLGYYQSSGLSTPGAGVIAALLPPTVRRQRLALAIGAPLDRLSKHREFYLERLMEAIASCY